MNYSCCFKRIKGREFTVAFVRPYTQPTGDALGATLSYERQCNCSCRKIAKGKCNGKQVSFNECEQRHASKASTEKPKGEGKDVHTTERVKKENEAQVRKIEQEYEARIKELEHIKESEHIKELEQIKKLERENEKLRKQNKQLETRSLKITSEMSRRTDSRGNFENVNDDLNNSRLVQRFESLYSNKWVLLALWMSKAFRDMQELERISFLTKLMKYGYNECRASADKQICMLWQREKVEDIPANEDISDFLQIRRQYAVRGSVRDIQKRVISGKLLQAEEVCALCSGENGANARKKLQSFLDEYVDCCWLVSVSNPPLVLDFDVVGKLYDDCVDNFKEYSSKKPVVDMTKVVGTICEVVWPCVQLKDESAIYMKGDVVVVKKGMEPKDND